MKKTLILISHFLRHCFVKLWNKQSLIFLFFLFLSAVFWLFTTLNEEYKTDLQIPVKLTGVPQNVVITTDPPATITVSVRDKGFILLAYKYGKSFQPLTIDFNTYSTHSGSATIPISDFQRQIQAQLSASSTVTNLKPQEIKIYFNYGESKRVPIRILGDFKAAEGAHVASLRCSTDSVLVYAPRQLLDTITAAYINNTHVGMLSKTQNVGLAFEQTAGIKFVPDKVNVRVVIDRMVQKTVSVPVQQVNFPATKVLRTFPSKVNITFQVGMGLYRHITADDFVLVVNYEDLQGNTTSRCHLALKSLPEGVEHARISPADVDFVIEELLEGAEEE